MIKINLKAPSIDNTKIKNSIALLISSLKLMLNYSFELNSWKNTSNNFNQDNLHENPIIDGLIE